jgi:hypothetical protein
MSLRFAKPEVGRKLRIVTSYEDGVVARQLHHEFCESIGVVVRGEDFDDPNSFRLETGNRNYPISIIDLNRVVVLEPFDGKENVKQVEAAPLPENQEWTVAGSKPGTHYVVRLNRGQWTCTSLDTGEPCMGFSFNGTCRHVEPVKVQEGL